MDYSQLINTMVVFVVLMTIGYVGARKNVLTGEFTKGANKLVLNVFLSASVLNSVIGDQPDMSAAQLWHVMLLTSLAIVICYIVGAVMARLLRLKNDAAITELLMSVPNTMFVGLPIVQELFGATAVLYLALSCIPFNVLLYSYGVWRLKSSIGEDGGHVRIKDMMSIPLIATLISLVIFFFRIPVPGVIVKLTTTMAPATMPLSMLVIGATLGRVHLLDAFREKRVYLVCFFRLVVAPLLAWFLLGFITTDAVLLATCVIIAGCPSGIVCTVLALQYGHNAELSSKGVLASTTLSMLVLPLIASLLV